MCDRCRELPCLDEEEDSLKNIRQSLLGAENIPEQELEKVPWTGSAHLPAKPETLEALFRGTVAGLCVPNFLTQEECRKLKQRTEGVEFVDYENVWPRIGRLGITVFEYNRIGKARYFETVPRANSTIMKVLQDIYNPTQRVMDWLSRLAPQSKVGIAHEDNYGDYFAGLLRRIEGGTMVHVDFAPLEQPDWAVGRVESQITWNIYLEVPPVDPGVVHIWKKQWSPVDNVHKIDDSYGYRPEVVKCVPCARIVPQTGMLMVTNTRNYHQVAPASGVRLTMSSAAGRTRDGGIILWS